MQLARKLGFQAVLGNHEEKAIRWLKHEDHCRYAEAYCPKCGSLYYVWLDFK